MFPGFPVEVGGVVELHGAFREESRTRGCFPEPRNRKSGLGTRPEGWALLHSASPSLLQSGFVAFEPSYPSINKINLTGSLGDPAPNRPARL